jgi:hypothetical protein
MGTHREELVLDLRQSDAREVCREAVAGIGWNVLENNEVRLICSERANLTSFTGQAKVEIDLIPQTEDMTRIILIGSMFGFGPIVSGHLKGQVGDFRNRIQLAANKHSAPSNSFTNSLASELERLGDLKSKGVISDEEFNQAKARLLGK